MKTDAFVLFAVACFFCTGCDGTPPEDHRKGDARWSTVVLAHHAKEIDQRIDGYYNKIQKIVEKRDQLINRIDADGVTDAVREDLKIRRSIELTKAQDQVDALEKYVSKFESDITGSKARLQQFQFDRNNPKETHLFDNIDRAEQALTDAKKRLTAIKQAWADYQKGKPLPWQI